MAISNHKDIVTHVINCVKQYPALYDTTHEDYNRYHKKIQIWNSIAAEVKCSDGKVAQTKWRNIRDSYVKHLKSLRSTDPAYKKYRNWQYVEQMSFLKQFVGGNKQKQNVNNDNTEPSIIEVVESVYGDPPAYLDCENYDDSQWLNNGEAAEMVETAVTPHDFDYSFNAKNSVMLQQNSFGANIDATDLLFLSYAKTLKSLSKKRQIRAKMKIAEFLGQAELEEENEKSKEFNHHVDSSESHCEPKTRRKH